MTLLGSPRTGRLKQRTHVHSLLARCLLRIGEVLHGKDQQQPENDAERPAHECNGVAQCPAISILRAMLMAVQSALQPPAHEGTAEHAHQKDDLNLPEGDLEVDLSHVTLPSGAPRCRPQKA